MEAPQALSLTEQLLGLSAICILPPIAKFCFSTFPVFFGPSSAPPQFASVLAFSRLASPSDAQHCVLRNPRRQPLHFHRRLVVAKLVGATVSAAWGASEY